MTTRAPCWLLVMLAATACSESPTAPSMFAIQPLGVGTTTEAFEYRHAANDAIDISWQESYHQWAIQALEIAPPRRIRYNKYQHREHMQSLIGIGNTNAFADAGTYEIHTIWARDNHEVVHLYSSTFGRAVALWSEGLAVAHQTDPSAGDFVPRWSRVALDDLASQFRASGRLVRISELLTTAGFREFDANVTYPEAGSFMRFILATCGLGGVKRFFATGSPGDSAESVAAQFEAACGRTIDVTEQQWLAALDSR